MGKEGPRIVFAGGGTGGHLYPALAVADELARRLPGASISFVGARRGIEQRLVPQAGYPLRSLRVAGIKGRGITAKLLAVASAGWAVLRCAGWLSAERPELVIGVGGYASGPAVLAARILKIRTMAMEQNHFPGATNRWLAGRVDVVCVPSNDARQRLGGVGVITGNPVRREFVSIGESPGGATLSLLVFGGSRGARSINRAMDAAADRLAAIDPPPAIVHQTGEADESLAAETCRRYPQEKYEVQAFLDDMPTRLAQADLVVCRAGASTIAELCAAGRPSILVPYPHAADDHQRHNAETLQQAGAATVVSDGDLDGERLASLVADLASDRERLAAMGRAARGLAIPDAAARIADVAERLIAGQPVGDGAEGGGDVP